ncbi:hypothetical protein GCM10010442_21150 [Kitasatospora kifunensis]
MRERALRTYPVRPRRVSVGRVGAALGSEGSRWRLQDGRGAYAGWGGLTVMIGIAFSDRYDT